ncbi:hypothetical protein ADIWIN_2624 [Winogradskyella psychrotolerans RS-3]|uniref:TNF family profile domain-containing protein n=1 Tax=Winogradskyella psychrotolerans RS-3 TaxID=641526 RepID=S7X0A3_9FLAO|nr:hypothetical protein [Winogradskyella psychrotolerans]EPR72454.1 hypothetical protein ADIWIN_2624 [Winogradskyella psychrotolerans RS-3]
MKSNLTLIGLFLILTTASFAQVGIGTDTPDASSILELKSTEAGLLLPRLTTAERDLIASPAEGLTIYNTTTQSLEIYTDSWKRLTAEEEGTPSLTMYRNINGGSIPTTSNSSNFDSFPLGASHTTSINTDYFQVVSNGKIKILKAGTYLINASWATRNLESGNVKYVFGVFKNGIRTGYLTRGVVNLPSQDFFGASGTFQHDFAANDVVDISYFIGNTAIAVSGDLMHIGIVKL